MEDLCESELVYGKTKEEILLEENGFELICDSPFEIEHIETGSTANGFCAECIIEYLENE